MCSPGSIFYGTGFLGGIAWHRVIEYSYFLISFADNIVYVFSQITDVVIYRVGSGSYLDGGSETRLVGIKEDTVRGVADISGRKVLQVPFGLIGCKQRIVFFQVCM